MLPPSGEGCLEVFLAEALRSASDIDKAIVDGCRGLVDGLPEEPYLRRRRLRSKATVGTVLSIMSPDWVFRHLDQKLIAVGWKEIEVAHRAYGCLGDP